LGDSWAPVGTGSVVALTCILVPSAPWRRSRGKEVECSQPCIRG
jgi:hypothetical protein